MTASPPFSLASGAPVGTDQVSLYPAVETTFRLQIASALNREHDIVDGGTSFSAHHKFGTGNSAARDAITDWVVGSIWFNTDTSPATLQRVVSIGPVVWETVGSSSSPGTVDNILQTRVFNRAF